jgi:hypothetical protein
VAVWSRVGVATASVARPTRPGGETSRTRPSGELAACVTVPARRCRRTTRRVTGSTTTISVDIPLSAATTLRGVGHASPATYPFGSRSTLERRRIAERSTKVSRERSPEPSTRRSPAGERAHLEIGGLPRSTAGLRGARVTASTRAREAGRPRHGRAPTRAPSVGSPGRVRRRIRCRRTRPTRAPRAGRALRCACVVYAAPEPWVPSAALARQVALLPLAPGAGIEPSLAPGERQPVEDDARGDPGAAVGDDVAVGQRAK